MTTAQHAIALLLLLLTTWSSTKAAMADVISSSHGSSHHRSLQQAPASPASPPNSSSPPPSLPSSPSPLPPSTPPTNQNPSPSPPNQSPSPPASPTPPTGNNSPFPPAPTSSPTVPLSSPVPPPQSPVPPPPVAPSPVTSSPSSSPLVPSPVPVSPSPSPVITPSPSPQISPVVPSPSPVVPSPSPTSPSPFPSPSPIILVSQIPVSPEGPRPGEVLPDGLLQSLQSADFNRPENVTVSMIVPGVTPQAFFSTYMVNTATTTATLSGTPVDKWIITAETIQQQQSGRRLQQQQQSLVTLSLLAYAPQLVWYRLTQPVIAAASRPVVTSCSTEFCTRLAAAAVPVDTSSISIQPSYGSLLVAATASEPEVGTPGTAGSSDNTRVIVGAAVGGVGGALLLLLLCCYRKNIMLCWRRRQIQKRRAVLQQQRQQQKQQGEQPTAQGWPEIADAVVYDTTQGQGGWDQQQQQQMHEVVLPQEPHSLHQPQHMPGQLQPQPQIVTYNTAGRMQYNAAVAAAANTDWRSVGVSPTAAPSSTESLPTARPSPPSPHSATPVSLTGKFQQAASQPVSGQHSHSNSRRSSFGSWDDDWSSAGDLASDQMRSRSDPAQLSGSDLNVGQSGVDLRSGIGSVADLQGVSNSSMGSSQAVTTAVPSASTTPWTAWSQRQQQQQQQQQLRPKHAGTRNLDPLEKQALANYFARNVKGHQHQTMQAYSPKGV